MFQGHHTKIVQIGLRYGMALFIASEVMFFAAFFWAFFIGGAVTRPRRWRRDWPPKGIHPFDPFDVPFLNTLVLLLSGTTVTWAHHALLNNDRKGPDPRPCRHRPPRPVLHLVPGLRIRHAAFGFIGGGIYPSTFFMATGFHGFHVIIGTCFLIVCLVPRAARAFHAGSSFRLRGGGVVLALRRRGVAFLFTCIYWWGSAGVTFTDAVRRLAGRGLAPMPLPALRRGQAL